MEIDTETVTAITVVAADAVAYKATATILIFGTNK